MGGMGFRGSIAAAAAARHDWPRSGVGLHKSGLSAVCCIFWQARRLAGRPSLWCSLSYFVCLGARALA
ncbi:hypothetical protein MPTK1_2g24050 [Marchantia polymorpha subsp. ruderalis]|uniref:Uncharacterized protein n=1 Tax=Marchantia polymorpha TaxID=3197 RepID=A0A2R6WPD1_MARPO|nr:hypothetical protein MARPO_0069s0054 [Marchantia polymorpha]BBN03509.1 hypothetical protein Mp_2g24050 [Marchantia polymorpha subsp. ruderalis]|eukprot:PTQ35715.1 hypothetical protein MARPO_0069s0054 [Marchantia polymorpha]